MAAIVPRKVKLKNQKPQTIYYVVYRLADGKQKWVKGYTDKTETERLARRLEEERDRIRLGDIDPQADAKRLERTKTYDAHVAEYKASMQAKGRDPGTVAYVIGDIEALSKYAAAQDPPIPLPHAGSITKGLIDKWVGDQQERQKKGERGYANKTINRRVASVQQWLRHLKDAGGVTEFVLGKHAKLQTSSHFKTRQARALTRDERDALLTCSAVPQHRRDLYRVVAMTGLRLRESRLMLGKWFSIADRQILVPAHVSKAKVDQRVPMAASIVDLLKGLCEGRADTPVFYRMPSKQHCIAQIREDAKAAGITNPSNIGFHSLRHTFCTLLARSGAHPALLQKLARHADIKTTLAYYVHLQLTDELLAIDKL